MGEARVHDVVVVGAGPIGSATARHLAARGADVVIVGPAEPADYADHEGVWSGHYDQGRLCHVLEAPFVPSLFATRSRRRFADLAERTGITFTRAAESLTVLPDPTAGGTGEQDDRGWFDLDNLAANAVDLGVQVERLDERALRERYPALTFEPGHVGITQPDALIVNPRDLVRAELAAAVADGAVLVRDEVTALRDTGDAVEVTARSGATWRAASVVVATGAATNALGLLPRPIAMETFGATVVLVEVSGPEVVDLPATMYMKMRGTDLLYGGIVMPPLRYPDGRWYVKCAGDSLLRNPLNSAADIARWVRTGGFEEDIPTSLELLAELLPGHTFGNARTRPCMVSSNPGGNPYIDRVDERVVVATEGERGVMGADEIGRLTAGLALTGEWRDSLPQDIFRVVWAD